MLEEIKAKIISQKQYYVYMCAYVLPVFGLRTTGRARKANKIYSSPCCLCVCVGDKFFVLQLSIQSANVFIFLFFVFYLHFHVYAHFDFYSDFHFRF